MSTRADVLLAHAALIEAIPVLVPVVVVCAVVVGVVLADRLRGRHHSDPDSKAD